MENLFCKLKNATINDLRQFIKTHYVWFLGPISFILFLWGIFSNTKKDFFTAASVILATIAIFENIKRNNISDQKKDSRFYLEKYIDSCKMIMELLKSDKPTRRITQLYTRFY